MKCIVCSSLFQDYLEKTLSQDIIDEMDTNFKGCEKCKICFRTYSLTIELSQKIKPPCCVNPEVVDRLRQMLIERFFTGR
jgi:hypothetical protein